MVALPLSQGIWPFAAKQTPPLRALLMNRLSFLGGEIRTQGHFLTPNDSGLLPIRDGKRSPKTQS